MGMLTLLLSLALPAVRLVLVPNADHRAAGTPQAAAAQGNLHRATPDGHFDRPLADSQPNATRTASQLTAT